MTSLITLIWPEVEKIQSCVLDFVRVWILDYFNLMCCTPRDSWESLGNQAFLLGKPWISSFDCWYLLSAFHAVSYSFLVNISVLCLCEAMQSQLKSQLPLETEITLRIWGQCIWNSLLWDFGISSPGCLGHLSSLGIFKFSKLWQFVPLKETSHFTQDVSFMCIELSVMLSYYLLVSEKIDNFLFISDIKN